ncbi:hypothetical protein [Kitasatospora sp. CMC57]|uniref:hypothetical protein n=1 Tax=Kitasatospora sp. CMC57 TaxID=3231513 RepID=UPI0038B62E67
MGGGSYDLEGCLEGLADGVAGGQLAPGAVGGELVEQRPVALVVAVDLHQEDGNVRARVSEHQVGEQSPAAGQLVLHLGGVGGEVATAGLGEQAGGGGEGIGNAVWSTNTSVGQ